MCECVFRQFAKHTRAFYESGTTQIAQIVKFVKFVKHTPRDQPTNVTLPSKGSIFFGACGTSAIQAFNPTPLGGGVKKCAFQCVPAEGGDLH